MELILLHRESLYLLHGDLSPGWVAILVRLRPDRQPRFRCRVADQVDDYLTAYERPTPPVLRDVAEPLRLDLMPRARPWRATAVVWIMRTQWLTSPTRTAYPLRDEAVVHEQHLRTATIASSATRRRLAGIFTVWHRLCRIVVLESVAAIREEV